MQPSPHSRSEPKRAAKPAAALPWTALASIAASGQKVNSTIASTRCPERAPRRPHHRGMCRAGERPPRQKRNANATTTAPAPIRGGMPTRRRIPGRRAMRAPWPRSRRSPRRAGAHLSAIRGRGRQRGLPAVARHQRTDRACIAAEARPPCSRAYHGSEEPGGSPATPARRAAGALSCIRARARAVDLPLPAVEQPIPPGAPPRSRTS